MSTKELPTTAGPWTPVCPFVTLPVEGGVTALVRSAEVAVFRTFDDQVYALGGHDPQSRTGHLAKGIVGSLGDVPFVSSGMHRRVYDLRTGRCLEDPAVQVPSYAVRVVDGVVEVGPRNPG